MVWFRVMRAAQCALLVAILASVGCRANRTMSGDPQSLTPERAAAVEADVRAFAQTVAHDVTAEGPLAWRKHFADSPAFFMADEGRMAFPNSTVATAGIQDFARTVKQMELRWGDDLRVDPLTRISLSSLPHTKRSAWTLQAIASKKPGSSPALRNIETAAGNFVTPIGPYSLLLRPYINFRHLCKFTADLGDHACGATTRLLRAALGDAATCHSASCVSYPSRQV